MEIARKLYESSALDLRYINPGNLWYWGTLEQDKRLIPLKEREVLEENGII